MSLDMFGQIDDVFVSIPADRISKSGGAYVDGIFVPGVETVTPHTVTIQPASDREIAALSGGGERVVDLRRVYVNDGVLASISEADDWSFDGQLWKTVKLDNRPWRNYCKAIVSRYDEQ
jgi:hypothetical protein